MKRSKTNCVSHSKSPLEKRTENIRVASKSKTSSKTSYKTEGLPSADKTNVVKTLIRNPTNKSKLKVPRNYKETVSSSTSKETEDAISSCSSVDRFTEYDLKVPSLCTAFRIADNLVTTAVESKSNLLCDLAASSKTSVNKKAEKLDNTESNYKDQNPIKTELPHSSYPVAIKKVNFPLEERLYKGLVNLQITDDDIGTVCVKPSSSKVKNIGKKKDPVPKLSDYYVPSFSEEFTVPPSPMKICAGKIQYYDGYAIINRMKNWEAKN